MTLVRSEIIRPMKWWDLATVNTLEQQLFPHDPWSDQQWWQELASDHCHYWVVEQDQQIVGYGGVSIQRPDADIQTMAIAPAVQGRGVGGLLLDTVIEHAREQGVRHIFLEVREDNVPALALYRRRGFEQISIRHRYYPDAMAAVVMRRTDPGGLS